MDGLDFLNDKQDWTKHRFSAATLPELTDGQVLLRVDPFAFTANNVTSAVAGDRSHGHVLSLWPEP